MEKVYDKPQCKSLLSTFLFPSIAHFNNSKGSYLTSTEIRFLSSVANHQEEKLSQKLLEEILQKILVKVYESLSPRRNNYMEIHGQSHRYILKTL
jgi:hypothetical protein